MGKIIIGDFEFAHLSLPHDLLKERRLSLGKTQQQVANEAKITLRQYQRCESGAQNFGSTSFAIGIRVCQALEINPIDMA
jgi:transcriptional regulator with XRE-family HTH domain